MVTLPGVVGSSQQSGSPAASETAQTPLSPLVENYINALARPRHIFGGFFLSDAEGAEFCFDLRAAPPPSKRVAWGGVELAAPSQQTPGQPCPTPKQISGKYPSRVFDIHTHRQ